VLLAKVDDALWRAERAHAQCTAVACTLRNLYSMSEAAGHTVDQQILSAMAARLRRAVGFRYVVGLYHPRCFVVVISAGPTRRGGPPDLPYACPAQQAAHGV